VTLVLAISLLSCATAAAEGSCSNDVLRSELAPGQLPDCRAYELVTPPYKEGAAVFLRARTRDGSRLLGQSLGDFAEAENDEFRGGTLGASYTFTRTASGWKARALDPPVAQFAEDEFLDSSVDLERSLWNLHAAQRSNTNIDLYLRDAEGSFVPIGPASLPLTSNNTSFEYRGGSNDLSRVLFTLKGQQYWPGDTTQEGRPSLYEYVGTGNSSPGLVGVSGGKGDTSLISQCGTELGSAESNDTYNAISASGSTVFFTAIGECSSGSHAPPTNELFARVDQSQTVAISEPSPADCAACNVAKPEEGHFEGASADGAKVFFTTKQPLLGTDTSDNIYEYDFANPPGRKVVRVSTGAVAAQVQGVVRISEDGSHAYFVAAGALTAEPNGQDRVAKEGDNNLYVYQRDARFPNGHIAFIARLEESDARDWAKFDVRPAQTTPDGRFLVFASAAHLTPDDTSREGLAQLFEYDSETGGLVRISVGQNGFSANGNIEKPADRPSIPPPGNVGRSLPTAAANSQTLSSDGSYVFFQSNDSLTPQATDGDPNPTGIGHPNIYEYHDGNVYLISDGKDTSTINGEPGVQLFGTNASGTDVFFSTSDALSWQDSDTAQDIYDARVGGGFARGAPAAGCVEDGCQGTASATTPLFAAPGSSTFHGPGNLLAPAPTSVKHKTAAQTRAEKLAGALKVCRTKPRRRRAACIRLAEHNYGRISTARRNRKAK
jgi:hypothetical protein